LLSTHQSLIGRGLVLVGEIRGDSLAELIVEGTVEGTINLLDARVTVRPSGQVTSKISAADVVLHGKVTGSITATNLIEIGSDGCLTGDAEAPRVRIEDGAFVVGKVQVSRVPAMTEPTAASTDVQEAASSSAAAALTACKDTSADTEDRHTESAALTTLPITVLEPALSSQTQLAVQ
jgi:cytoskeletal protein CcmA (bactofilin family)